MRRTKQVFEIFIPASRYVDEVWQTFLTSREFFMEENFPSRKFRLAKAKRRNKGYTEATNAIPEGRNVESS
jgi:hypothetical protein